MPSLPTNMCTLRCKSTTLYVMMSYRDKCLEFAKRWEDWDKRSKRAYNMGGYDSFMEFIEIASHDEDELL